VLALLRKLEEHRFYRALRSVVRSLDEHDAPRAASAIAFDAFLSLIPLTALAGHALSRLTDSSALVLAPLIRAAPPEVADAVSSEFERMARSSVVAPISIVVFLWISSAGISTAMGVFETIYGSRVRPWYVRRAIAALCVLASIAAVPAVAALGVLIGTVWGSLGMRVVAVLLPGALLVFLVAAFFRIAIQHPPRERRPVVPGAIMTVALWAAVSALFSLYVTTLARYTTFYGSLATAAMFLLWLWLLALALFVGGELNARLEREHAGMTSLLPGRLRRSDALAPLPKPAALPADAPSPDPDQKAARPG
jgi:membrane protein